MSICREVAGFSFGHADIVRRAMAKKKAELLNAERDAFINGAVERNIDINVAGELFDELTAFANYAFNKSHATAYAIISYQTAYLKAHYPAEYMSSLLTSVQDNLGKLSEYINECSKLSIKVLPPDVNASGVYFTPSGDNIVFGLLALKNVGKQFIENIISERRAHPFSSFEEFLDRMSKFDINKRMIETLIKVGAFDNLGVYRSQLLKSYEHLITVQSEKSRNNIDGQLDMFSAFSQDNSNNNSSLTFEYPDIPEFSLKELLMLEKESSGMYFSGHPIESYENHINHLALENIRSICSEENLKDRKPVRIAGVVTALTVKTTRSNDKMAFVSVEDRYAEIECIIFSSQYSKYAHNLRIGVALMISGVMSIKDDDIPRIVVSNVEELIENKNFVAQSIDKPKQEKELINLSSSPSKIYLKVSDFKCKEYLKALNIIDIFEGNTKVIFFDTSSSKYMAYSNGVDASNFVVSELKKILKDDNVVLK